MADSTIFIHFQARPTLQNIKRAQTGKRDHPFRRKCCSKLNKTMNTNMTHTYKGTALVRGAASELGLLLCTALSNAGCHVVGLAHSAKGLERLRTQGFDGFIPDTPESVPEQCMTLTGEPLRYFADLAHSRFESLLSGATPDAIMTWAAQDIGLRARMLRAVTRSMLVERAGRCLFVSSVAASRPAPGQAYYAAAKLAGESLFASAGTELACRGITACSLRLSWIDVGRGREFLQKRAEAAASLMPGKKLIQANEAIQTMLFLLSDAASGINATTVTMDGGFSATKPEIKEK